MDRNAELEAFKMLNLTQVAAAHGYEVHGRPSPRASSVTMAHPSGDKIVIARSRADQHWIYFSVRDDRDHGTVIDFLQHRGAGTLGEVRKQLRPWLSGGGGGGFSGISAPVSDLQPIERDIAGVRARFEGMSVVSPRGHPYLTGQRGIPGALLHDMRFVARIRTDARGNAVFPHFNRDGVCGFELKNTGFTGFAKGGAKGLWASHIDKSDRRLVVAESAIDALSYAALHGLEATRFVSLAGQVSPEQRALLEAAATKLTEGGEVVLALDNDAAGHALAEKLTAALQPAGQPVRAHAPPTAGQDWNDVLRARFSATRQTDPTMRPNAE